MGVCTAVPPPPTEGSLSSLFLSPSLPPLLHPPFSPSTLLVYFLRARLFASPGWRCALFFLSRRDLRPSRVFNIIRGSSIIPTLKRTEVGLKKSEERRGMFYRQRCYKLFRIVKNSRWTGDFAGQTYGIFHYRSSFALFFSTEEIFHHLAGKNFNAASLHLTPYTAQLKKILIVN